MQSCDKVECPLPIENLLPSTLLTTQTLVYSDKLLPEQVSCPEGYIVDLAVLPECLETGEISNFVNFGKICVKDTCEIVDLKDGVPVSAGTENSDGEIEVGESYTFQCLPGFARYPFNASLTVTCDLSGNLTQNSASCQDESALISITSQAINTVQADLEQL